VFLNPDLKINDMPHDLLVCSVCTFLSLPIIYYKYFSY